MKSLVRDVMTTEVVTVEPGTPFKEIVTRLVRHRISAVPVLDAEGNVQGRVERRSLIPYLVRAVHAVEGVVRVEDRLTFDVDDHDPGPAIASSWGHRR